VVGTRRRGEEAAAAEGRGNDDGAAEGKHARDRGEVKKCDRDNGGTQKSGFGAFPTLLHCVHDGDDLGSEHFKRVTHYTFIPT